MLITIAGRESIKVYIYTKSIFHCYAFVINSSSAVSHCSTFFTLAYHLITLITLLEIRKQLLGKKHESYINTH